MARTSTRRISIRRVAPTIAAAMGVKVPDGCKLAPLQRKRAQKVFVFAGDSVPERMVKFLPKTRAILGEPLKAVSVFPSVTPVNFASAFTGLMPRAHGIVKYERPVLKVETLFDTIAAAGKKAAICAVAGQSMDTIFRQRPIDYYGEVYDPQIIERADALLKDGRHDLVLAYNQGYDDADHATGPDTPEALAALKAYDEAFARLFATYNSTWAQHDRLCVWLTDHGCHLENGKGTHGSRRPVDMHIPLFFRHDAGNGKAEENAGA
jgi:predicted AlkP superfamily pyrophosphatase or phosphodiesterase